MFTTLEQIAVLPDALGAHACESGHPEMRRLPDGVFHCPACGSEVLTESPSGLENARVGSTSARGRRTPTVRLGCRASDHLEQTFQRGLDT
jgi:hypothetical protein